MWKRILFTLPLIAVAVSAQVAADRLGKLVSGELDSLTGLYEHLHRHPELSFYEEKTAARLVSELEKLGFDVTPKVGGHGFVAVLKNGEGPTVMIRTDLDGLPVVEKTGRRYASDTRTKDDQGADVGVMHACAHGIHMTSFVGTARMLARLKPDWSGTLVMIGQPAEERGAGARAMIEDGLFTRFPRPDYVLGLHADAGLETGYIGYGYGFVFANVDSVDVTIRGVGGHGAAPHLTKDPIVIASQVILALQTIVSREVRPTDSAVVTVGSIHGGTKHNIISGEVKLQITVRSYSDQTRQMVLDSIRRITANIARAAGVPADREPTVKIIEEEYTPSTYNDPALVERLLPAWKRIFGNGKVDRLKVEALDFGSTTRRFDTRSKFSRRSARSAGPHQETRRYRRLHGGCPPLDRFLSSRNDCAPQFPEIVALNDIATRMNIMKSLALDYLATMRDALTAFGNEIKNYLSDQGIEPAQGSQAASEQAAFARPESLVTARSKATFLFESGGEHMGAFVKTITEPMETIACFTCVRCMLEPCALASWLLDPSIDARTRVGRVFALRYEDIQQGLKYVRSGGRDQSVLQKLKKRVDDVEQVALSLGYAPVVDKNGKRIGIGLKMPSATEVIERMLKEEEIYRLFSAVAHGHDWATRELTYKRAVSEEGNLQVMGVSVQHFEKTVKTKSLATAGLVAVAALAKPLWYQCRYNAWDEPRLIALLEGTFDKLHAAQTVRFWRVPSTMLKHRRTPITPSTKVAALLEEYPELEDVLIAMVPPFKKLRNPVLRKSVAKVASLGQAAAAARMPAADLVNRLRAVVGQEPIASEDIGKTVAYFSNQPDWFDNERIVASIDEREADDQDRMTVTAVLEAAARLRKSEIVELITTFVPAPGIDLMKKKGFLIWCVEREPELINTYFSKSSL